MKVCRVRVEGLRRTKNDIVVEQIKEVLKAETLNEVGQCFQQFDQNV